MIISTSQVNAGLLAYGLCQTACNAAWVSCYAAAGIVAGATGGAALPPAAIACNVAQ
ncbi:10517_t:CDS:2, partial [Entrophospora sp. SA101]